MNIFEINKVVNALEKNAGSFNFETLKQEFDCVMNDLEMVTKNTSQKQMQASDQSIGFISIYFLIILLLMLFAKWFIDKLEVVFGLNEQFATISFLFFIVLFVVGAFIFFVKVFEPYMTMRKHKRLFDGLYSQAIIFQSQTAKFFQTEATLGEMVYVLKTLGLFYAIKIIEFEKVQELEQQKQ